MFYSIDLFLVTFLVLCYVERKGRLPAKKEALIAGITFFSALAVKGAILLAMDHHLLKAINPSAPKLHLGEAEKVAQGVLIWSGTLFAPVWGPYFYAVQFYREKYDPEFIIRDRRKIYKSNCEASNFDFGDLSSDCFTYLQFLQDSSDQVEKNTALDITNIAIEFLEQSNENVEVVCSKMIGFADFYKEMNLQKEYTEIMLENCFKRSCFCRSINIQEFDLSVDQVKYIVEQKKKDVINYYANRSLTQDQLDRRLWQINLDNISTAKVFLEKQDPEADKAAIEYLNFVIESATDAEIIKDQLAEANELMSTITNKTESADRP